MVNVFIWLYLWPPGAMGQKGQKGDQGLQGAKGNKGQTGSSTCNYTSIGLY